MSVAPLPTLTCRPPGCDGETRPRMGVFTDTSVCLPQRSWHPAIVD
jgi:hypothetical protein